MPHSPTTAVYGAAGTGSEVLVSSRQFFKNVGHKKLRLHFLRRPAESKRQPVGGKYHSSCFINERQLSTVVECCKQIRRNQVGQ